MRRGRYGEIIENMYWIYRYSLFLSFRGMNMLMIWEQQREYWELLKCKGMIEEQ